MDAFRAGLRLGDRDVRASVLDDLSTFHGITPDEARARCLDWERDSVAEWAAVEDRVEFYRTMQSWSFGYRTSLADLSSTLLDFARFRLKRRGVGATYVDLGTDRLPAGHYDVITAIDTLAHVPDVAETGRELHAALRPGGVLIANFDIRDEAPETVWHLHDDDLRAGYELRRAGFAPIAELGYGLVTYRSVHDRGIGRGLRTFRDWSTLVSPPRRLARRLGRPLLRAAHAYLARRHGRTSAPAAAPAVEIPTQRASSRVGEPTAAPRTAVDHSVKVPHA